MRKFISYIGRRHREMTFKGHSRSSEMSRFDRAHYDSNYTAISCIVSQIIPDIDRKLQRSSRA